MSATATAPMAPAVLAHLERQIDSARRLLAAVLEQGKAIRARDVEQVLATMTTVQAEMTSRGLLERERTDLLQRAGQSLGIPAESVTLEALTRLLAPLDADAARQASAVLRGLLAEVAREHGVNRALMRQELSFLEHLTRMLGAPDAGGYAAGAARPASSSGPSTHLHVLDLEA